MNGEKITDPQKALQGEEAMVIQAGKRIFFKLLKSNKTIAC